MKPQKFTLATLETTHFTFTSLGKNREQAEKNMEAGWKKYCKLMGVKNNFDYWCDSVQYSEIGIGDFLRDGALMHHEKEE